MANKISEEEKKESQYIKFEKDGEEKLLYFDLEKVELIPDQFDKEGKKPRCKWKVVDLGVEPAVERFFTTSMRNGVEIASLLKQRYKMIKVKRSGSEGNTKYAYTPVQG